MTTTGEKLMLLAEIIRVSTKGATQAEISEELSLTTEQTITYVRFLKSRRLLVQVPGSEYFPTAKGLSYLSNHDDVADLVDLEGPDAYYSGEKSGGNHAGVCWDKRELAARLREIIDR